MSSWRRSASSLGRWATEPVCRFAGGAAWFARLLAPTEKVTQYNPVDEGRME